MINNKQLPDGKYHKSIWLPRLVLVDKFLELSYTYHAIEASKTDRYGLIELPAKVNPTTGEIVEIEILNGRLSKIILQTKYSLKYNLSIVILTNSGVVKSVWLNDINDKHASLDKTKYNKKPSWI